MGPTRGEGTVTEPEELRSLAWEWTYLYAANASLPLAAGLWLTFEHGGLFGLLAALLVGWLVGLSGCYRTPRILRAVTDGAMFVAVLQLLPVCHVAAGVGALLAWEWVGGYPPFRVGGWQAELSGFVVTLLTTLALLVLAWILGRGPGLLFSPPVARTAEEVDYIDPQPVDGPEAPRDS